MVQCTLVVNSALGQCTQLWCSQQNYGTMYMTCSEPWYIVQNPTTVHRVMVQCTDLWYNVQKYDKVYRTVVQCTEIW